MILSVSQREGQLTSLDTADTLRLYEIEAEQFTFLREAPLHGGTADVLMTLMSSGVNAVLAADLTAELRAMLSDMGIPAFGAPHGDCEDAIRRFLCGDLHYTATSCGGGCSSCSGSCGSCGGCH